MATQVSLATNGKLLLAVDGQGIYFRFGRKKDRAILNDLNIAVNSGEIYSLLGPSGCGKTTLLKCIIGQHNPEAGSLKIYGRSPGSKGFFIPGRGVGYMPQDLALYMDMNTEETLTYYGTLYGMGMKNISERIKFLIELLELPNIKKEIQHLSGGQQRRVSFAIALIHKPPLIILDEPTVGVDPVLRKSIWDHLIDLAKNEHLTVIITTHYTEEARQANTVGLMRNGHLLVERNPEDLIKQCGGFTLEDVFFKLCQNDRSEDEDHETNIDELIVDINGSAKGQTKNGTFPDETVTDESYANTMKFLKRSGGTYDQSNDDTKDNTTALLPLPSLPAELRHANYGHGDFTATSSSTRVFYLTRKNFLRLKRNIPLLLFTIGICSVEVVIFFLCVSSYPFDLQIAVVNEEQHGLNHFSENFLLSLSDRTFYKKPFYNFTLAYESLKRGQSWATLHIDPEFSTCLTDRVLEGVDASNDTVQCSTINLVVDTSNYIIAGIVRMGVWESYQRFATELLGTLGKNPLLGKIPVDIEEYPYDSKTATFADFACPALIVCVAYITSIGLTEMSIIAERKHGLLSRALVAGATTTEVMLSFFFALLVVSFLQLATMLLVTFYGFNVSCNGPVHWCIVAVVLTGICGMSYGFLISSVTDDENAACLIAFGSFFPTLLLSAAFWPLEAMPYYLRLFSYYLPLTRIIETMRSVMIRGWNITDNYTWDGYLICSFWIVLQTMLAIIVLKIRR